MHAVYREEDAGFNHEWDIGEWYMGGNEGGVGARRTLLNSS